MVLGRRQEGEPEQPSLRWRRWGRGRPRPSASYREEASGVWVLEDLMCNCQATCLHSSCCFDVLMPFACITHVLFLCCWLIGHNDCLFSETVTWRSLWLATMEWNHFRTDFSCASLQCAFLHVVHKVFISFYSFFTFATWNVFTKCDLRKKIISV